MSDRHEDGASGQEPVCSLMDSDAESGGGSERARWATEEEDRVR